MIERALDEAMERLKRGQTPEDVDREADVITKEEFNPLADEYDRVYHLIDVIRIALTLKFERCPFHPDEPIDPNKLHEKLQELTATLEKLKLKIRAIDDKIHYLRVVSVKMRELMEEY